LGFLRLPKGSCLHQWAEDGAKRANCGMAIKLLVGIAIYPISNFAHVWVLTDQSYLLNWSQQLHRLTGPNAKVSTQEDMVEKWGCRYINLSFSSFWNGCGGASAGALHRRRRLHRHACGEPPIVPRTAPQQPRALPSRPKCLQK
jgi:hypothetical protein